ncbi:MAG: glycosyltransferase family 2 protein [Sulfuricurvum sp.]|nr:glycosyltransferase family 2 protein [Sulfuricurvum sp.]
MKKLILILSSLLVGLLWAEPSVLTDTAAPQETQAPQSSDTTEQNGIDTLFSNATKNNGAVVLEHSNTWDSLRAQTFRDFEWLVVDDASTDGTRALVEGWRKEASFTVRYYRQEKLGKHRAFNKAVELAQGALFLPLDSDDGCVPAALERFAFHWNAIEPARREKFSAVTARALDQHGNFVGDKLPADVLDSDSLEIKYRWKVKGEMWGFQRTDILRRFPFPDMSGVNFVPEGVVWSQIARGYKTRFINEPLRINWIGGEGGQLSAKQPPAAIAPSHALWHESVLNNETDWLLYAPLQFLRSAAHYIRFSLHCGTPLAAQLKTLASARAKLLWWLALPAGLAAYALDRLRWR